MKQILKCCHCGRGLSGLNSGGAEEGPELTWSPNQTAFSHWGCFTDDLFPVNLQISPRGRFLFMLHDCKAGLRHRLVRHSPALHGGSASRRQQLDEWVDI